MSQSRIIIIGINVTNIKTTKKLVIYKYYVFLSEFLILNIIMILNLHILILFLSFLFIVINIIICFCCEYTFFIYLKKRISL